MSFGIAGVGLALPEHSMNQQEATQLAQQVCCTSPEESRMLAVLYRKAGVQQRYTAVPHRRALDYLSSSGVAAVTSATNGNGHAPLALAEAVPAVGFGPSTAERMEMYSEFAGSLALRAARAALAEAAIAPNQITHLVTVTCTGFFSPGVDIELIQELGLNPTTERIQVGFMGCHGAINGLRAAQAIAAGDPTARVLLVAVELCSLHYRYQWDPERFIGNALFADGAAACVGGAGLGSADWRVKATGSCLVPHSTDAMTWRIGDHGFEMTLSSRVPELIQQSLRPWLTVWLGRQGADIASVGSWAIHPGGPRILSAVEEALGLDRSATRISREVLAEHGNMSSPTVLFIFNRLRAEAAPGPLVMLGFGPGLMAEAALLERVPACERT